MSTPAIDISHKRNTLISSGSLFPPLAPVIAPSDFLRSFQKIKYASKAQRTLQLDLLKKARIQSIDDHDFTKVIRHLENVAMQPQFLSEYVTLLPWKAQVGFLEEGASQYFTVTLKDNLSPLHVVIQRSKGNVETYFSYKSLKPGPDIYDRKFKGSAFKIEGRFNYFREPSACLCVQALSDCTFAIMITFGESPPAIAEEDAKLPIANIAKMHEKTFILSSLEELFSDLSTAPSTSSCDFVNLNRTIGVGPRGWTKAKKHRLEVKKRHFQAENERKELMLEQAERNNRRQEAQKEANLVTTILARKAKFEKMWLGFIYFARTTFEIHRRFQSDKQITVANTQRYLLTFRIQRNYHKSHKNEADLPSRQLILLRNHVQLLYSVTCFHTSQQVFATLMGGLRESYFAYTPARLVEGFFRKIVLIQKEWRLAKTIDKHFTMHLSNSWDFLLSRILQKQEEDGKKKRKKVVKKLKKRKYSAIPQEYIAKMVAEAMAEAVARCREANKSSGKVVVRLSRLLPKLTDLKNTVKLVSKEIPDSVDRT